MDENGSLVQTSIYFNPPHCFQLHGRSRLLKAVVPVCIPIAVTIKLITYRLNRATEPDTLTFTFHYTIIKSEYIDYCVSSLAKHTYDHTIVHTQSCQYVLINFLVYTEISFSKISLRAYATNKYKQGKKRSIIKQINVEKYIKKNRQDD